MNQKSILCPHCESEMKRVHDYLNDKLKEMTVWYCIDCDFTLALDESVVFVKWDKK